MHLRLRLEQCSHKVSVAILILAPVFKILKQGVQLIIWVPLKVAVDADVAPVTNLHPNINFRLNLIGK